MPRAVILGVTADIGRELGARLMRDDWQVAGLGRDLSRVDDLALEVAVPCEASDCESIDAAVRTLADRDWRWDLFVSAVGTMEPIGQFFEQDFDAWERSVTVNSLAQLRVLHALWPLRSGPVDIMFMAGGGTNNPFTNYSAYCVSKILLIKMCELLDDETDDANVFIIGPGFTRTRIHEETLRAGAAAGDGLDKTRKFLTGDGGTSMEEIYDHMRWCMAQGRSVAGGRNFSTVHDPWGATPLAETLRGDPDAFRLRRAAPRGGLP